MCCDGKPDGGCGGGGTSVLVLFLGQQQCTVGFRDMPPTRGHNAIHTATQSVPTAALGWHSWNHSTVTAPHPSPDASSNEAEYQHHFAAVWRGGRGLSPRRKQDWFVLNVRKFFTAVEEPWSTRGWWVGGGSPRYKEQKVMLGLLWKTWLQSPLTADTGSNHSTKTTKANKISLMQAWFNTARLQTTNLRW